MPVKAASGKVLTDDQQIDIALSSCLPPCPGAEQDDADKVLSVSGVQDTQEALQILGNCRWQHWHNSSLYTYAAMNFLDVSFPWPWITTRDIASERFWGHPR